MHTFEYKKFNQYIMSTDPKQLMDRCLEIEGLLALLIQRGDKVPDHLYQLLNEKAESLAKGVADLSVPCVRPELAAADEAISESVIYEEDADADICEGDVAENDLTASDESDPEIVKSEEVSVPKVETQTEVKNINDHQPVRLSLNDKFRFRRELFNFSDEEMEETLDVISNMSSGDEIDEYLFNDLCWDQENEVVRDFMSIVKARFQ